MHSSYQATTSLSWAALDYVFCCARNAVSASVCVEVATTEEEAVDHVGRVPTGGSGVIEFNIVGCGVGGEVSEEVIEIGLVGTVGDESGCV